MLVGSTVPALGRVQGVCSQSGVPGTAGYGRRSHRTRALGSKAEAPPREFEQVAALPDAQLGLM